MNARLRNGLSGGVLWLLMLLVAGSAASGADVDKIIKKMQKKYRSAKTIQIHFKEITQFSLTGTTTEVSGVLHMQGQKKFRLETEDQVIVSDGKTIWQYNKLESQVLIDNAKNENQEVLLNNFLYEINDHYFGQILEEKKEAGKKRYLLKLTPKPAEQSFFTEVRIWVVDKTWEIVQAVYTDYNDNVTKYVIDKMAFNPALPDTLFTFTPPEGVPVVDLRF